MSCRKTRRMNQSKSILLQTYLFFLATPFHKKMSENDASTYLQRKVLLQLRRVESLDLPNRRVRCANRFGVDRFDIIITNSALPCCGLFNVAPDASVSVQQRRRRGNTRASQKIVGSPMTRCSAPSLLHKTTTSIASRVLCVSTSNVGRRRCPSEISSRLLRALRAAVEVSKHAFRSLLNSSSDSHAGMASSSCSSSLPPESGASLMSRSKMSTVGDRYLPRVGLKYLCPAQRA
jgi:hypothetical protein